MVEINTKCRLPSFFHTNTMVLHQALCLGLMVPDSNISFKWFLTSSNNGGGICLNHSLKGVSSITFMICSIEWVQPNSAGSNENTSWYLARSQWAASANSGVQESKLPRSNLSNNFPCLCLTVSLGVWKSADLPTPSCNPLDLGGSSTGNTAATLATGDFFWWSAGMQYCCVPLQLPLYCPFSTQYMCSVQSGLGAECHPLLVGPVS